MGANVMTPGFTPSPISAAPTVGAGYFAGLLAFAMSKGADRGKLLAAAKVRPEQLESQAGRIPFESYVALMRTAKQLTGDSALALHYGEQVDISRVSVVGVITQGGATPVQALSELNRFVRLVVETDNEGQERFEPMRDRQGLWLVDTRRGANAFPELTESAFAQLVCAARRAGSPPPVRAVRVTHPAPEHRAEYERIFQAPVEFDSNINGLLLDEIWASRRIAHLPEYAVDVLREHAMGLLKELESSKSVRGRVESRLVPMLHRGEASMDQVARQMGMSRQTLFRRLKAEGVTFEQVLDGLRHRLALHYLCGKKLSVNATAYLLGFSDPSAFSRAFKRWTGSSPSAASPSGTIARPASRRLSSRP